MAHLLDELADACQRWLHQRTNDDLLERGLQNDFSFAPVDSVADALEF